MRKYKIEPLSRGLQPALEQKINQKTKPLKSLGRLEELALQIGLIQQSLHPQLSNPHLLVFAADHGIAREGVSAYPPEVTWQMVMNFLTGGAAINVLCRQHHIALQVVDAGVNYDFAASTVGLIRNKAGKGTANFLKGPAMSIKQAQSCMDTSANLIGKFHQEGCNVIGFGEMGIGNTSSASLLMSVLCNLPLIKCIGRGTGLDERGVSYKLHILAKALDVNGKPKTPLKTLATYGGFEIAQITGAILQAAQLKMVILIDGFIASVAYLVAQSIEPAVKDYCIFCHLSGEQGHQLLLEYLQVKPILNLEMRLGEGTGVAVAYPIIQSAVHFLNEMACFESARISTNT